MSNNINLGDGSNMKSSIGLFYQITVKDKQGKIVSKTRLRRSKSFCLAFLQALQVQYNIAANVVIKDTLAANETCVADEDMLDIHAASGVDTLGLLVGTGTTPATNIDYVMETKIAHGGAATQLNYGELQEIAAAVVGANVDYQLFRAFTNTSGGTIQVTETGIYCWIKIGKYSLIIHDVFTAVAVANGETITVTYTFRTTV
ncbi:hypothetical protein ES705_23268 [subsurface metagenome]